MSINVTPLLLTKYHQGLCTDEEKEAVVDWLLDPEDTNPLELPSHEQPDVHKALMWQGISSKLSAKPEPPVFQLERNQTRYFPFGSFSRMATAACLVLGLFSLGIFLKMEAGSEIAIDNLNGHQSKNAHTAGLSFTLSPQSKAEANTSGWSRTTQITFCGAMKITNESDQDINLVFHSDCKNSPQQTVRVAKGRSYLAMHYRFKTDEIIVVDKARLLDLPPALVTKAIQDFQLI